MEYLMTYGWAILIIAVVLGALFQLGVFNASIFAPRAPPGACQVLRPNGPGTSTLINLEGVCSGELPQYSASFNGTSSQYIYASGNLGLGGLNSFAVSFWEYPQSHGSGNNLRVFSVDVPYSGGDNLDDAIWVQSEVSYDICYGYKDSSGAYDQPCPDAGGLPLNSWTFLSLVKTPTNWILYVNGVQVNSAIYSNSLASGTTTLLLGALDYVGGRNFFGSQYMADFQVYNTSLSANEIAALYLEGIGGAPIKLQNLVGWWPLNGNANDYSGNNDNGAPNGVTYTNQWTSGYTAP